MIRARGGDLAAQLCAHATGSTERARRTEITSGSGGHRGTWRRPRAPVLRVFLQTPHGDMPRYQLTPAEMDDVVAYLSLRALSSGGGGRSHTLALLT